MKTLLAFFMLCTLRLAPAAATAGVIHVPADQPTIQAGIDAAVDSDVVLVADGVWTGPGNRDLDFSGRSITVGSLNGPQNCIIDCESQGRGFHFHSGEDRDSVVRGFTIRNGIAVDPWHAEGGGGILIDGAAPLISGCIFTNNHGAFYGGGCNVTSESGGLIADCVFRDNYADRGGGLFLSGEVEAQNCLVTENDAFDGGGGIFTGSGNPTANGCTISHNHCIDVGGGIYVSGSMTLDNCIVWGNDAELEYPLPSDEAYLAGYGSSYSFSYSYLCSGGNWYIEDGSILDPGPGIIEADPLFAEGPEGDCYLSQVASGQAEDSPCVDAGDPAWAPEGTTRTDHEPDTGIRDIGYHHPSPATRVRLLTGPGPGYDNPPVVRVHVPDHDGYLEYEFNAYGAAHYGTIVTSGDVDGDELDEILTGPGPGDIYGPHVRGFERDGSTVPGLNFLAYGTNKYGVNVAAGDIDGDGIDEIITGAGPGAVFGPHVRGWIYDGAFGVTPYPGVSYFAYGTPKWGVNVTAGDIDGDGFDEIITGAGPGAVYGPHVRGWDVDGGTAAPISGVSYFAYGTLKYGVNVSCGDVDGDGIDEIVTGAGPGAVFGPHVRGWNYDGDTITPLPNFSLFAWLTGPQRYGVNIFAGADINDDGLFDVITGRGPDPEADTEIKVFTYVDGVVEEWMAIDAFEGLTHGANVAAGRF